MFQIVQCVTSNAPCVPSNELVFELMRKNIMSRHLSIFQLHTLLRHSQAIRLMDSTTQRKKKLNLNGSYGQDVPAGSVQSLGCMCPPPLKHLSCIDHHFILQHMQQINATFVCLHNTLKRCLVKGQQRCSIFLNSQTNAKE